MIIKIISSKNKDSNVVIFWFLGILALAAIILKIIQWFK